MRIKKTPENIHTSHKMNRLELKERQRDRKKKRKRNSIR
jgi:hypothetical protein